MSIQNVGGSPEVPEYKTPDDVDKNFKPADVYNSQKIGNALAGIEQSVSREIEKAMADGVVDDTERQTLNAWLNKAQGLSNSIANIVSKTYEDFRARFDTVIQNIEQHIGAKDRSYEPTETDSRAVDTSKNTEINEKTLRIPDRKFMVISDRQSECEIIKKEYNKCLNNPYNSNRKKASDLKCFQAKYEVMLKTVASSIDNDGIYDISTLYDQVGSQIRYYDKLADRDAEQNQQDLRDKFAQIPSHDNAAEIAAAKRPEGPDPRANWVKIVNPDQ